MTVDRGKWKQQIGPRRRLNYNVLKGWMEYDGPFHENFRTTYLGDYTYFTNCIFDSSGDKNGNYLYFVSHSCHVKWCSTNILFLLVYLTTLGNLSTAQQNERASNTAIELLHLRSNCSISITPESLLVSSSIGLCLVFAFLSIFKLQFYIHFDITSTSHSQYNKNIFVSKSIGTRIKTEILL